MSCDCDDCTGENAKRKLRQQLALVSKQNADNLKMRGEYMKERDDARSKLEKVQQEKADVVLDATLKLNAAELQVDAFRKGLEEIAGNGCHYGQRACCTFEAGEMSCDPCKAARALKPFVEKRKPETQGKREREDGFHDNLC